MKNIVTWICVGIVGLLALWTWSGYNAFITGKEEMDAAWAKVQVQYQRRFDLVPNLVATVKGAANFEQSTLTNIIEARTRWLNAGDNRSEQVAAGQQLDSGLSRLIVTVEQYPQLKAVQAYQDLMTQLEGTENRIGTARQNYASAVMQYNLLVKHFPGNLLARIFSFFPAAGFTSDQGSDAAPSINFD